MIRLFLTSLLFCAAIWSCGGADLPAGSGLVFHQSFADVGERWAGEQIELEFPFSVVASPVTIDSFLPECGCLTLQLWVQDQPYIKGTEIAAGSTGVLKVHYNTAGFRDRKFIGINIRGSGEGVPVRLEVRSWLRSWFELQPRVADFGVVDGKEARILKVAVRGQQPFRITKIVSQAPPLQVQGVPSAAASLIQEVDLVLPPTTEEGPHVGFFSFATDQEGYTFRLAVRYEVAGDYWTVPDRRLLLGELRRGVEHFSVIEVGARVGQLGMPDVKLLDLPGAEVQVEKLATKGRYRVHLRLLPESTKVHGEVVLSLPFSENGLSRTIERRIQVLGVVRPE